MSDTIIEKTSATVAPSATFGFVKLVVRELEPMLGFYERVLGLVAAQTIDTPEMTEKILRKPGQTGGAGLILYRHKDGREIALGTGYGPIGFYVRDVDAAFEHAVSHGATPHREPWDTGNLRVAFVLDPEGREIELVSVKG